MRLNCILISIFHRLKNRLRHVSNIHTHVCMCVIAAVRSTKYVIISNADLWHFPPLFSYFFFAVCCCRVWSHSFDFFLMNIHQDVPQMCKHGGNRPHVARRTNDKCKCTFDNCQYECKQMCMYAYEHLEKILHVHMHAYAFTHGVYADWMRVRSMCWKWFCSSVFLFLSLSVCLILILFCLSELVSRSSSDHISSKICHCFQKKTKKSAWDITVINKME